MTSKTTRIDRSVHAAHRSLLATAMSLALAATTLWTGPACGQSTATPGAAVDAADAKQKADATRAYKAGVSAMDKDKDPSAALEKFRESYGIVASPNTHMLIVRTLAESRQWLEAYHEAQVALAEAKDATAKDAKYQSAIDGINVELQAIHKHIAFVTVKVGSAVPDDATLTVAGNSVAREAWGQPIPLAPGEVAVVLTSSEGEITETVQAPAGKTTEVSMGPAPEVAPAPAPAAPPPPPEDGYSGPDRRILAVGAGAVGLLGFVGFGAFGLLANAQFDRLESGCRPDPEFCDPDLEDDASKGRTYQAVANAGLAIGIIGVAAGAGLFVWDVLDSDGGDSADAGRPLRVGVGPASVSVGGSF